MISLICFLLTLLGSINWFCIGVLQYDFVAGLFGSQANVFSRIIYALIGLSSIWLVFALIKGKGKIKIDGKRSTDKSLIGKNKKQSANTEASMQYDPNRFNGFNGATNYYPPQNPNGQYYNNNIPPNQMPNNFNPNAQPQNWQYLPPQQNNNNDDDNNF